MKIQFQNRLLCILIIVSIVYCKKRQETNQSLSQITNTLKYQSKQAKTSPLAQRQTQKLFKYLTALGKNDEGQLVDKSALVLDGELTRLIQDYKQELPNGNNQPVKVSKSRRILAQSDSGSNSKSDQLPILLGIDIIEKLVPQTQKKNQK